MIKNLTEISNENRPHSLVNVTPPSRAGDPNKVYNKNSDLDYLEALILSYQLDYYLSDDRVNWRKKIAEMRQKSQKL